MNLCPERPDLIRKCNDTGDFPAEKIEPLEAKT